MPFTVDDEGKAERPVTLSEPVREAQLPRCVAVVKRSGADVTSPARGLTFDTEGPRLAIASPLSAVSTPTFKVEAVVRSAEDGATATLSRSGSRLADGHGAGGAGHLPGGHRPRGWQS